MQQELFDLGGRNIALAGLPPLGCLPPQITLHGNWGKQTTCIEEFNAVALKYNEQYIDMINNELKPNFHGGRLIYLDLYTPLDNILKNPQAYGPWLINPSSWITQNISICVGYLLSLKLIEPWILCVWN